MGLDTQTIFADLLGDTGGLLLDNGILIGALIVVAMTLFLEATSPNQRARIDTKLEASAIGTVDDFLRALATRIGWNDASAASHRPRETAYQPVDYGLSYFV